MLHYILHAFIFENNVKLHGQKNLSASLYTKVFSLNRKSTSVKLNDSCNV